MQRVLRDIKSDYEKVAIKDVDDQIANNVEMSIQPQRVLEDPSAIDRSITPPRYRGDVLNRADIANSQGGLKIKRQFLVIRASGQQLAITDIQDYGGVVQLDLEVVS